MLVAFAAVTTWEDVALGSVLAAFGLAAYFIYCRWGK